MRELKSTLLHDNAGVIYEIQDLTDLYTAEGNFESAENTYVEVARAMQREVLRRSWRKYGVQHPTIVKGLL